MTDVNVAGYIRGAFRNVFGTGLGQFLQMADGGELLVSEGVPPLVDTVRRGASWQVASSAGLAALTALPTTTAGLSLWNGEPGGGKSYVIESIGAWEGVADATQTDHTAMFACMNIGSITPPTDAALAIKGFSGKKYGGVARTLAAGTIVNDGWFAHGSPTGNNSITAVAGGIWKVNEVPLRGLYIVPPGYQFNIVGVKGTAAALQLFYFIRWHEMQLALA